MSESLMSSILICFKESGPLLNDRRSVMMEMFPENASLVDLIPSADQLTLAKHSGKGMIMVDSCNTAQFG